MSNAEDIIPMLLKTPGGEAVNGGEGAKSESHQLSEVRRRRQSGSGKILKMSGHGNGGGFDEKQVGKRSLFAMEDLLAVARRHPIPCFFSICVLFFMLVEYTLFMVPSNSPPFDVGFVLTKPLQQYLAGRPNLNTVLAGMNTVFVAMQMAYILATLLLEGRGRSTIASVFMFTCRGLMGYTTQLPVPQEFLGSGVDFPVGNVSFFLFYSGHVAAAVIASLDMRRTGRQAMAAAFDAMNILQVLRLLATRGHYTIDLAAGVMAGILFDELAGKYERRRRHASA